MIVRETERLRLRWVTLDDAQFMFDLVNDPDWLRFVGDRNIHDLDASRKFITSSFLASYAKNGFGLFLTEQRADGLAVGINGIVKRDGLAGPDVGFALLPAYRGLGYAHEAGVASLDFARQVLGLRSILAITDKDNASSGKVLNGLGLHFKEMVTLPGQDKELRLFEGAL